MRGLIRRDPGAGFGNEKLRSGSRILGCRTESLFGGVHVLLGVDGREEQGFGGVIETLATRAISR